MTFKVAQEQEVLQDVVQVLFEHLPPDKIVRFWAAWQRGGGDYLALRRQLFEGETVQSLFEKVEEYQAARNSYTTKHTKNTK